MQRLGQGAVSVLHARSFEPFRPPDTKLAPLPHIIRRMSLGLSIRQVCAWFTYEFGVRSWELKTKTVKQKFLLRTPNSRLLTAFLLPSSAAHSQSQQPRCCRPSCLLWICREYPVSSVLLLILLRQQSQQGRLSQGMVLPCP